LPEKAQRFAEKNGMQIDPQVMKMTQEYLRLDATRRAGICGSTRAILPSLDRANSDRPDSS
jgi:hypothetical protein